MGFVETWTKDGFFTLFFAINDFSTTALYPHWITSAPYSPALGWEIK